VDTPEGHYYAQQGDVEALRALKKNNPNALLKKDRNGWTPLHEAVRGGHGEAVKFLISAGADKNQRTSHGYGASPLALAIETLTENHPVSRYLMGIGAENIGPDEL
jgi:prolyl 4-hydroxylase